MVMIIQRDPFFSPFRKPPQIVQMDRVIGRKQPSSAGDDPSVAKGAAIRQLAPEIKTAQKREHLPQWCARRPPHWAGDSRKIRWADMNQA